MTSRRRLTVAIALLALATSCQGKEQGTRSAGAPSTTTTSIPAPSVKNPIEKITGDPAWQCFSGVEDSLTRLGVGEVRQRERAGGSKETPQRGWSTNCQTITSIGLFQTTVDDDWQDAYNRLREFEHAVFKRFTAAGQPAYEWWHAAKKRRDERNQCVVYVGLNEEVSLAVHGYLRADTEKGKSACWWTRRVAELTVEAIKAEKYPNE